MASSSKVAIVTGSNKGIGFTVVEELCKKLGASWDVFLTSRDEGRGLAALEELRKKNLSHKFHQLDVDDKSSIQKFAEFIKSTYGGLDILVNNAAIAFPVDSTAPFSEQAVKSLKTNFWSLIDVCDAFFPLLRPHARVVNVSSGVTDMILPKCSPELQKRLTQKGLTQEDVKKLMTEFTEKAVKDQHKEIGWPSSAYGASKIGVRLISYAQARELARDPREDIVLNSCCPGYVATDMTKYKGNKTTLEGADTLVYLALLPPGTTNPKGEHVYERKVREWKV